MTKSTAAERYRARKARSALAMRRQTLKAADEAVHHLYLAGRFGPDLQRLLDDAWRRGLVEWSRIVDEHNPAGSGVDAPQEHPR